jgi:dienelactone hydrolase
MWGGIGRNVDETVSAWSVNERDLPFALFDRTVINWDQPLVRCTPGFTAGLSDAGRVTAAQIPVERINGPILLISGEDDQVWPAKILSNVAVQRLRGAQHPFKVEHLCYEGAGHAIGPPHPFAERRSTHVVHPVLGYDFELGGSPELNAKASRDSWERVVPFLQERFASI